MSLATSHRKAPLRTYGGNRRGRFAIFRDSDYAVAKEGEKYGAEARKANTEIAPEPSVDVKNNLGIKKLKTNLPNNAVYEGVDSSVEIAQRKLLKMPSQVPAYAVARSLPTGSESKDTDVNMIMKLKEKSTNAVVKPTSTRTFPLQTPATHSIKAQIPKSPPKKKPQAVISLKQSPSPSRRWAKASSTWTGPTLEDQDFPNIISLSTTRAHNKGLSILSVNPASITTATAQRRVHESPQNPGISEQILLKGPSLSFLDMAKEAVTDKTRAVVKFLPALVQPKRKRAPKKKARRAKGESLDSTVGSKWKAFGKDANIRSQKYEEVVDPTDSEDLREGNITRTWKYSPGHRVLGAEESYQNLLYGPTSESDADGVEASVGSPETYEASDAEMIMDNNSTFKSNATPHSKISGKRLGKYTKGIHRQETFNDDTEQGFDGDVEMLTGEDDYDLDESSGLNTKDLRVLDNSLLWENTPHTDSDGDVTLEDSMATAQLDVKMTDVKSKVSTPLHVKKYDELMAMEIEMATKKRSLENSPIRSSYGVKRKYSTARKISLIAGPPGDLSNLSEDELCSPNYMVVPFAARYDQDETPSKTRNIKGKVVTQATRRILKPATDHMETD
ncbi:hypothetical protein BGX38DRAFT_1268614 [Terfezia claveryi]|nr:hypothetical protein BGX38DRAFT_1268614 [Terfezia claveryi]